jgi:hypothetical protein
VDIRKPIFIVFPEVLKALEIFEAVLAEPAE